MLRSGLSSRRKNDAEACASEISSCYGCEGLGIVPARIYNELMFESTKDGWDDPFSAWSDDDDDGRVEELEDEMRRLEWEISSRRARQAEIVARLDRLQVDLMEGSRNMRDWISVVLDCGPQFASRLRRVAAAGPDILERLGAGAWSLDRAALLSKLREAGASADQFAEAAADYSLGRIVGLIERLRQMSRDGEADAHRDRYLVFQPDLAAGMWKLWGQVPAADGETIWNALHARETDLPALPDQTSGQRMADALTSICMDSFTAASPGPGSGPYRGDRPVVYGAEVFVDAAVAAPTLGEAGATFSSGLKAGPNLLAEILCCGRVRTIGLQNGTPVVVTNRQQAIPPAVRKLVFWRDQGQCSIAGCRSRYRLQIHHLKPRSQGGDHHPDNLILLCWYHHHVAIHTIGMTIDPASPVHRRRLLPLGSRPPPPPSPPPDTVESAEHFALSTAD
jgi:hypothetical protein